MICSNFFRFLGARGKIHTELTWIFNFLGLLAVKLSTSCVSNVLAGKPQKLDIFASCCGLRVLAAQELLAPLLARALFLGSTVFTSSQSVFRFHRRVNLARHERSAAKAHRYLSKRMRCVRASI